MTAFGLVLAALAAWQAVEVWQHGSIFATQREEVRAWPSEGVYGFFRELLDCPFCQSVWAGTAAAAVVAADLPSGEAWYAWAAFPVLGLLKLFVYGLAVSRLANLANDVTYKVSRTPNQSKLPEPPDGYPSGDPEAGSGPNNDIKGLKIHDERTDADLLRRTLWGG